MTEVSSSQESLPLSQETFAAIWETIPQAIQNIGCGNVFLPNVSSIGHIFEDTNSPKPMEIESDETQVSISQIMPSIPQSSLPSIDDVPGIFNFTVSLNPAETFKSSPYLYSEDTKKLYVRKDAACPFNFSVNQRLDNCFIRAVLYFTSKENIRDVVVRCISHSFEDRDNGIPNYEHFIKCESPCSKYFKDDVSKRLCVTVPFENPSDGEEYSTYLYKFLCFTSCSGGPNRRPFSVVFTLENGRNVLGRCKIDLKVCSSPFRDKAGDEKIRMKKLHYSKLYPETTEPVATAPKPKRKKEENPDDFYVIKVKDKECYDLLKVVKKFYYMKKIASGGGPNWVPTSANDFSDLLKLWTSSDEEKENSA